MYFKRICLFILVNFLYLNSWSVELNYNLVSVNNSNKLFYNKDAEISKFDLDSIVDDKKNIFPQKKYLFQNSKLEQIEIPLHISEPEVPLLKVAALSSVVLFLIPKAEVETLKVIQKNDSKKMDNLMNIGRHFGEEPGAYLALASMAFAVIVEDQKVVDIVPVQFSTMIAAGFINNMLKVVFRRALPKDSPNNPLKISNEDEPSKLAFPSNHTTSALVAATIISENLKHWGNWVSVAAYTAAALTAYSRMYHNEHWATDVIASLYSVYLARAIMREPDEATGYYVIKPYMAANVYGLSAEFYDRAHIKKRCGTGSFNGYKHLDFCIDRSLQHK